MKINKYLNLSLLILIVIYYTELPFWVALSGTVLWIIRLYFEKNSKKSIPNIYSTLLSIAFFAKLYFDHHDKITFLSFTSLLFLMVFTKFLTYSKEKEKNFIILISFLLIGIKTVLSYDLVWITPILVGIFSLWGSMNTQAKISQHFSKMIVYSLPLTLFMFFMFPRVESSLFKFNSRFNISGTGFSENLKPGDVSSLLQDETVAFRAEFSSHKINIEDLYWRGSVLDVSNGIQWYKSPEPEQLDLSWIAFEKNAVEYLIFLEPQRNKYLFSLENTIRMESDLVSIGKEINKQTFHLNDEIYERTKIKGYLNLNSQGEEELDSQLIEKKYLQLNSYTDPAVFNIALSIKKNEKSKNKIVSRLASYYKSENFKYTLEPGTLTGDFLQDFLINKKTGYCEHYAGASATLLRMMGVPARVVIGYQGGVYNQSGQYWSIVQKDAHAWVEYLNDDNSWVRFDPVLYIEPKRILNGADFLNNNSEAHILVMLIKQGQEFIDNLNYQWIRFLLNYNESYQKNFIKAYGLILLVVVAVLLSLAFLYSRWKNKRSKMSKNKYDQVFEKIVKWAKKKKIEKLPQEGLIEFLEKLMEQFPSKKNELSLIKQYLLKEKYKAVGDKISDLDIKKGLKKILSPS